MSRTIETTVSVCVDDVLDDISDEDLIAELESRKKKPPEALEDVRHALMGGRAQEALALLERIMFPRGNDRVRSAFAKANEARDPATGRPVIQ